MLPDNLEEYQEVFAEELGVIHPFQAKLSVAKEFHRAKPVPSALKSGTEEAPSGGRWSPGEGQP